MASPRSQLRAPAAIARGLSLVVAAIVPRNTDYLERAVQALADGGQTIDEALLRHLSPLGWEQINVTGDYVWRQDKRAEKGGLIRILSLPAFDGTLMTHLATPLVWLVGADVPSPAATCCDAPPLQPENTSAVKFKRAKPLSVHDAPRFELRR